MALDNSIDNMFPEDVLKDLFPADRTDQFFDALYGDASEGAYDIGLEFGGFSPDKLHLEFHLTQRPGKCLACYLTQGLPQIFSRHPVIDIDGMVREICRQLDGMARCRDWQVGRTREVSDKLHVIPLTVFLDA